MFGPFAVIERCMRSERRACPPLCLPQLEAIAVPIKYPCTYPGCPELTDTGGPCERHRQEREQRSRAQDRQRGSAASRGYGRRWRRIRAAKLARDPLCEDCLDRKIVKAATDVDHIDGNVENMADENLRSLCHECHSAKTVRENGAFGRPKGRGVEKC
jgi:5-methylcytosine-specific restriction protein A